MKSRKFLMHFYFILFFEDNYSPTRTVAPTLCAHQYRYNYFTRAFDKQHVSQVCVPCLVKFSVLWLKVAFFDL